MRLVVYLGPAVIAFTEPLSGGPFPYLKRPGPMQSQARAGFTEGVGLGQTPNMTVVLCGPRVPAIIAEALRARADFYDDAGELVFPGVISGIGYAINETELTLEG